VKAALLNHFTDRSGAMTTATGVIPVISRADHIPGPAQGQWTYSDYLKIPE
jgi:hypothetical protein